MNKTARNVGLIVLAAGALVYPAIRLYRYIAQRRKGMMQEGTESKTKAFAPSYRGNHKPHHRKVETNGHLAH